jgi:5-hydroxyisourate hydrolase-like protein (transthyretin family)
LPGLGSAIGDWGSFMKTRGSRPARWAIAALVVCGFLFLAAPAFGYTITGTVTSFATGQPVAGVELQLWKYSTDSGSWVRPGIYAESGADGTYSMSFNDDGQYRVECYNSTIYADQWWNHATSEDLAFSITVPGDSLTGIDFSLFSSKTATAVGLSAPSVCAYRSATLTGSLKDADDNPLAGRVVTIKASTSADWAEIGSTTTDAAGKYTFSATPSSATDYQVVFDEEATYAGSSSGIVSVLPRVSLSKPSGPTTTRTTTTFTCDTFLKPRHTAGTSAVTFQCDRLVSGHWLTKKTVKAKAASYSSYTKCTAGGPPGGKGLWWARHFHAADAGNAKTMSVWRTIKVR